MAKYRRSSRTSGRSRYSYSRPRRTVRRPSARRSGRRATGGTIRIVLEHAVQSALAQPGVAAGIGVKTAPEPKKAKF